ncbi:hypothetical protein V6N13_137771 [Hibiscus sabdariffa]
MLQFAKRLASKGVKATLVTTVFLSKSSFSDASIDLQTVSDGFDECGYNGAPSGEVYLETFWSVGPKSLASLIKRLVETGDHPVGAIVYDGFLSWTLDVAKQFGVPSAVFFTQSCSVNSAYYHVNRGHLQLPLPRDTTVSLPGLPPLQVSELPSFIYDYGSSPTWFDVFVNQFSNIDGADWVFFNTFYELEKEVLDWMSSFWKVLTIGPTIPSMYLDKRLDNDIGYGLNLFEPETCALNWLDGKPKGSVVYVSFGSLATPEAEQMEEVAWALKGADCNFLWVVRGTAEKAKLPSHFIEETKEKGLVVSWCHQLEVLSHQSICCFLTHCGLGSTLEALSLGVPMLAMPLWTDQITNAKQVEEVWGIGIKVRQNEKGLVTRGMIEQCLKELLKGEKAKEIKENTIKWKNLARKAMEEAHFVTPSITLRNGCSVDPGEPRAEKLSHQVFKAAAFPSFYAMEDMQSVATLIDSTASKIQQLQKAFAELESQRALTLNMKWKELEEHFSGLEKSLKRRFHELEDQEKVFETKTRKACEMLQKREAAVVAKEQATLVRLQEKRDAAVFAITNALEKHGNLSSEQPADVNCNGGSGELSVEEKPPDTVATENNSEDVKSSFENGDFEVKSYPQLVKLCEEMDSKGLQKFISDNRKNLAALKEEIPWALKAAASPARLVLESLEGFYLSEVPNADGKKDSNLLGLRRTCIMLMECLSFLLSNLDMVSVSALISEDIKDQAKLLAKEWKPKLDSLDMDASNGNSLEAHAFLQLLATFVIASDFNEEELSRLIPMVSRRRQAADLCRSLGLSEKMPGVIEVLVNSGRQIDAVNLAFAFELTQQFSPVPLLKSYLKDARKSASPVKPGNASPTAQTEVSERELAALKAVIKCIEEHSLEGQYPVDPLQKRVLLLEKAKADKKRATEAGKPQPKRPRANGAGYGPRVTNVAADKTFYPRVSDRYVQYVYDRPYVYPGPADNHNNYLVGSATYNFSPNHGNYFEIPVTYLH